MLKKSKPKNWFKKFYEASEAKRLARVAQIEKERLEKTYNDMIAGFKRKPNKNLTVSETKQNGNNSKLKVGNDNHKVIIDRFAAEKVAGRAAENPTNLKKFDFSGKVKMISQKPNFNDGFAVVHENKNSKNKMSFTSKQESFGRSGSVDRTKSISRGVDNRQGPSGRVISVNQHVARKVTDIQRSAGVNSSLKTPYSSNRKSVVGDAKSKFVGRGKIIFAKNYNSRGWNRRRFKKITPKMLHRLVVYKLSRRLNRKNIRISKRLTPWLNRKKLKSSKLLVKRATKSRLRLLNSTRRSGGWTEAVVNNAYVDRYKRMRWWPQTQKDDPQVKIVWKGRQQLRRITKVGGRVLYRPLRPKFPKWWKLGKIEGRRKRHRRDRFMYLFKWFARTRNDLEIQQLYKRKMYARRKKLLTFLSWKLALSKKRLNHEQTKRQLSSHVLSLGVDSGVKPICGVKSARVIVSRFWKDRLSYVVNEVEPYDVKKLYSLVSPWIDPSAKFVSVNDDDRYYDRRFYSSNYADRRLNAVGSAASKYEQLAGGWRHNAMWVKSNGFSLTMPRVHQFWRRGTGNR